jgi:vesicle-associated membrane protein 4
MADREQPYDPYIPAAGAGGQQGAPGQNGNHRTAALQAVCVSSFSVDIA